MSGPKGNNGAVMPLALGGLLAVALMASVAGDKRFSDTVHPGFDNLSAEVSIQYQPVVETPTESPTHKPVAAKPDCDDAEVHRTLDIKVFALPAELGRWTRAILTSGARTSFSI